MYFIEEQFWDEDQFRINIILLFDSGNKEFNISLIISHWSILFV